MINWFVDLSPQIQALLATIFTWFMTMVGASLVFFVKKINKNFMDGMLGFAAGVMIAASFYSLLSPALEMAENLNINVFLILTFGFLSGGLLLFISDNIYSRCLKSNSSKRSLMLISSITLHNIPEGLAVGVLFGSIPYGLDGATLFSAITLAIGIGIQNFPEGSAVSFPLRREGNTRLKSFFYGQASGLVEPMSGFLGALLVLKVRILLPFFLAFAAGAMIYVVVQELIPESQTNKQKDIMALFTLIGFSVMMILDIALG